MQRRNSSNSGMGVGRFFSRGGAKSGEIWFLPLEIENTTFFANNFKIQGANAPLPSPSDAHKQWHGLFMHFCRQSTYSLDQEWPNCGSSSLCTRLFKLSENLYICF